MEFKVLKKSHIKRNILIGVLIVGIISAVILQFTRAKYRVTQSMPLVNGTINYELSDFNLVGIYLQGEDGYTKSDIVPESGYVFNEEESYCTVNGKADANININYDIDTKLLTITPMTTKGTKCTLYFDIYKISAANTILANKTISTRTSFASTLTENTTGTIYQETDDNGITYYFAGAPNDNYVSFAGFYWRIIRINGDGSIRLIYDGTTIHANGEASTDRQIGTSAFNGNCDNNMYVGYMYTSGQVHGLGASSTIKGVLDRWYENNLLNYANYIDLNAGFCGDRTIHSGSGTGTTVTYYAAYNRLVNNKAPTYRCGDSSDLYTTASSNKGNHSLIYPIGLITVDEIAYAGGVYNMPNSTFYLYTNSYYWTMSPRNFISGWATVFIGGASYSINVTGESATNGRWGIRPVINLRADVTLTGSGTMTDPYRVN